MAFRACDQCRNRRIKCDYSGTTLCSPCTKRGLKCTFQDPVQKRGPKPKKLDENGDHPSSESRKRTYANSPNQSVSSEVKERIRAPEPPSDPPVKSIKLGLEQQLIDHFMTNLNPSLGPLVTPSDLQRIQSLNPTISETFLFFGICTYSAIYSDLGARNPITLDYYSRATDLILIGDNYRDDPYFKGLVIMDKLKKYFYDTMFHYHTPYNQH